MSNQAPSKVVEGAIAAARKEISDLLDREPKLRPFCIRIAFYDAISYNPTTKVDGPNGSIRLWEGLTKDEEMKKEMGKLDKLKANGSSTVWTYVSYADLYQLAGVEAVRKASGPSIEFQHGRMDSCLPVDSSKVPLITEDSTATYVKDTFHRIGFNDKEIVAISSAYYYWMNYIHSSGPLDNIEQPNIDHTYYQKLLKEIENSKPKASSTNSIATSSAATMEKQPSKSTTSVFHYWKCLISEASFRKHVEHFAKDPNDFAKEYANAHKKLSELGFKHFPQPIPTEAEYHDIKHGIAFAMAMTILFGFVGFFYEVMRT